MATSRLPEITVSCRKGHDFRTRAHGGQGVDCPQCRAEGERVKVWIRKDRPRTARELAEQQAIDAPAPAATTRPDAELLARWAQEAPWDGKLRFWAARDTDKCPECSGAVLWDLGRTVMYCQPCNQIAIPTAVITHYERRAELATRASSEIATRSDPVAEQAARVRLRALKDGLRQRVESWLGTIADPDSYDRVQYQRQARQLAAMLEAWLPEINEAGDETALAATWAQTEALVTGDQGRALASEYEQAQDRAQRQREARQRAAEYAQQQREMAEQEQREQREAERAAKRAAREEARQRKAITSGTASGTASPTTTVGALAPALAMIEHSRQEKFRKIAEKGECDFKHWGVAVASRIYGVPARDWGGNMNGYALANAPQYRACPKHYATADARLTQDGYSDHCFWEL